MRRIFLTSGLVLCLACPAFADIAAGTSSASCTESVLESTTGPVDFVSDWRPMISAAITLNSNRYTGSNASPTQQYTASRTATPTPLYAIYERGVYSSQPTVGTLSDFTTGNRLSALTRTPQLTGYTFEGFYTTPVSGGTQVIQANGNFIYNAASTQFSNETSTSTWYARWSPEVARINYGCGGPNVPVVQGLDISLSGATGATTTSGHYDGSMTFASTMTGCELTGDRGGYHFGGWECDRDGTTGNYTTTHYYSTLNQGVWTVSQTINPWKAGADTTCEVIWKSNTYNITYAHGTAGSRTTGFSGSVPGTTAFFGEDQVTIEGNGFDIPGYTFAGWVGDYDNASGDETPTDYPEGDVLDPYIIGHDLTLTAQWSANHYTVTYNSGSCTNSPNTTVYTHSNGATYDSNYTVPAAANNAISVKTGYTFVGWNTVTGQTTNNFPDASATPWTRTNGITVYAACSPNPHTLSYSCGSAPSGATESVTGSIPASYTSNISYGSSYTLSATYGDCALPGYHATGWDCSGGATLTNATSSQSTWTSDANISCTVHWTANTITLNYYQDENATTTFATDTCTYDGTFTLPTNYQPRPGYHFNGWNVR